MNPRLHADITARLDRDFQFKEEKGWLRKGTCPACGKKELYAKAEAPWVLRCGRLDKCAHVEHVKDLYADLFEAWSERYPATASTPTATADAYMRDHRGFDLARVKGWYQQESYYSHQLGIGSATVRFALPGIGHWERIIDRPHRFGKRKANFSGSYTGAWWQAPGSTFVGAKELWLTEGIFDAIALLHVGLQAAASLSCNNFPEAALRELAEACAAAKQKRPRLVFAYDTGKAGEGFTHTHVRRARELGWEATAAQPPHGRKKYDWNELFQLDRLRTQDLEEYLHYGALLIAPTPTAKAGLIYQRQGWNAFPFDHDRRLYWWKLDLDKYTKVVQGLEEAGGYSDEQMREEALKQSATVTEVCNCLPTPLYFMRNEVTDEAWYYFRIEFPHDAPPVKNTFTAGQLSAAAEFKKRLLHSAGGAIWTGTAGQLDKLLSRWTYNIKSVQTIDFVGYSLQHGCYVFNDVAVQGERVVPMNDEDYFDLGKLSVKSLSRSLKLDINTDTKANTGAEWFDRLYLCFGPRGMVALAAWMGALFAEQVRDRFESFPFVEIVGEPGSGKSTLLEALWKLVGRAGYEGFDPMKGSMVGFMRTMAQVSNLPVVLIESDRDSSSDGSKGRPQQGFHWDSLKSLYNGGSLRTTGVKSAGNDTYDPQFRGALLISQNAPVMASAPIMERIVHLWFDKSQQSEAGREAALELGRMSAQDMSAFMVRAITAEAAVMGLMEKQLRSYERQIAAAGSKNLRIQKNHAQLMVFVDALAMACPITSTQQAEAKALLLQLALEREQTLLREDPVVEAFWEAFDYLDGTGTDEDGLPEGEPRLNHARDDSRADGYIAINLNHFMQLASERRQPVPLLSDLKRLLKTSRNPRFVEANVPINSGINGRHNARITDSADRRPSTVRCWVFKHEGRHA